MSFKDSSQNEFEKYRVSVFDSKAGEWYVVWRGNSMAEAVAIVNGTTDAPASAAEIVTLRNGMKQAECVHMNEQALQDARPS